MSSSPERQRPRVAGARRRHGRPAGPAAATATAAAATAAPAVVDEAEDTLTVDDDDAAPAVVEDPARTPAPAHEEDAEPVADEADADGIRAGQGVLRRLAAPLVALALSLLALAGVASVSLGDHDGRQRDARAATAAARGALEQLLSYDHTTVAAQAQRNTALLTGPFRTEYGTTMTRKIVPLAQKEQAVVRARAYEAGVMSQTDTTVVVQVFLNQAKTSAGQKTASVDQNRVIATMQRVGGRWLVAGLEAY